MDAICINLVLRVLIAARFNEATTMTTLQIRQMPQPLYDQLTQRAAQFHRSLTQQAIADLSLAQGSDVKTQRLATLRKIRTAHASQAAANPTGPQVLAAWLREDRDR